MHPPIMHSSPLLFFVLLGVFSLPSISFPAGAKELPYCHAFEYLLCGGTLYNVSYPFRLEHSPPYCGHPGFDLRCPGNISLLTTIGGKDYVVNSIDYLTQTLHLTDQSFADKSCNNFTNSSFDPGLFGFGIDDANLTVYFNCSPCPGSLFSGLGAFSCFEGANRGNQSFYTPPYEPPLQAGDVGELCASLVTVPISGYQKNDKAYDFSGALRKGFALTWKAGDGWCKNCTVSKGICGNDGSSANGEACFCSTNSSSIGGSCVPIKETGGMSPLIPRSFQSLCFLPFLVAPRFLI